MGTKSQFNDLIILAKNANQHTLQEFIEKNSSILPDIINSKDSFGSTSLHLACFHNLVENVRILLNIPEIQINVVDMFSRTPFYYACKNGSKEIVELFIQHGDLDINIVTDTGETCLLKASYYGHKEVVELLLKSTRVLVDTPENVFSNTALHCAAMNGFDEIVDLLLQKNTNKNILNSSGNSPLHLSVLNNHLKCVETLLKYHCDLEIKNNEGKTAVEYADQCGFKEISESLKNYYTNREIQSLKQRELKYWTPSHVSQYIGLIGFPQYRECFIKNEINATNLFSLNLTTMKNDLGISPYGHRTMILEKIRILEAEEKERKKNEEKKNRTLLRRQTEEKEVLDLREKMETHIPSKISNINLSELDLVQWKIEWEDLELNDFLGKGYFGEVRKAKWKQTDVAVKMIYRDSFGSKSDLTLFYKELAIISQLRHPNILSFFGCCTTEDHRCIVTEYLSGGNLYQYIHLNWESLERSPILQYRMICDIVNGLAYLHSRNILHRDLTTKNLLLDINKRVKLCDFGLSRIREESGEMTSNLGCLSFQAPEVFRGELYSEKADIYSFSIVCFETLTGTDPSKGIQPLKFANLVAYEKYRPNIPPSLSNQWNDLITRCWSDFPNKRPSSTQLLKDLENFQINLNEKNRKDKNNIQLIESGEYPPYDNNN